MTLSIQRPPDAAFALFHRFENTQPPLNSQLTIGADDCVVVISNGSVLGIVPPGVHWVHPQPFPFLLPAIVGGSAVQVELWFVKTIPVVGIRFGGALPSILDPGTKVLVSPRTMGDFSLTVRDPARLVTASVGLSFSDAEPVFAWVKQLVLRQLGSAISKEVEGGTSILSPGLMAAALDRVAGDLGELESSGLAVTRFGEVMLSFPEDEREALKAASTKIAMAKLEERNAAAAPTTLRCTRCSKPHEGGRFCVECGGPLANG